MSEWHPYRIKDIAQLISIKSEDLTLPYIALDNIISWDATFVPSDSATDGNSNLCEAGDVLFRKQRSANALTIQQKAFALSRNNEFFILLL